MRRSAGVAPRLPPVKGKRLSPSPKATPDRGDSRRTEADRTACWAVRLGRTDLKSKNAYSKHLSTGACWPNRNCGEVTVDSSRQDFPPPSGMQAPSPV